MSIRDCLVLVEGAEESWDSASGAFWCDRHVLTCKHSLTTDGNPTGELVDKQKIRVIHPDNPSKQLKVLQILADENPDLDAVLLEVDGGPRCPSLRACTEVHSEDFDGIGYPDSMIPRGENAYASSDDMGRMWLYASGSQVEGGPANVEAKAIQYPSKAEREEWKEWQDRLSGFSGTLLLDRNSCAVGIVVSLTGEGYSQVNLLPLSRMAGLLEKLPRDEKDQRLVEMIHEERDQLGAIGTEEEVLELIRELCQLDLVDWPERLDAILANSGHHAARLFFELVLPYCQAFDKDASTKVPTDRPEFIEFLFAQLRKSPLVFRDRTAPLIVCVQLSFVSGTTDLLDYHVVKGVAKTLPNVVSGDPGLKAFGPDSEYVEEIKGQLDMFRRRLPKQFKFLREPVFALLLVSKDPVVQKVLLQRRNRYADLFGFEATFVYHDEASKKYLRLMQNLWSTYLELCASLSSSTVAGDPRA